MTDKKISELDAITGANTAADDLFIVVDSSGTATKKISRAELNNAIELDAFSTVNIDAGTIDGVTMATSDITVGSGKTLNVSAGTLTLADDQISGDKINGGTITSTFSGNLTGNVTGNASGSAATVTTAAQPAITSVGNLTSLNIVGTTTSDFLVIQTNEDGAGTAPDVTLYRNSASPADNDYLGKIEYRGRNDNSQDVQYGYIAAQAIDVSDGTEDGRLLINSKINGADHTHLQLDPDGVAVNGALLPVGDNNKALGSDAARWASLTCAGTVTFGWGSAGAPGLAISADTNTGLYRAAADAIGFTTGGTTRARLDSDGLKFGSDTAAANALSSYEEGTWTATLTGSTSNPSSAVTVTGNYTKTGNLVWVQANFGGVNTTGAAGAIRVTGLPFTPSPGSQHSGSASVHTGATIASGVCNISPSFESSYLTFYATKTAAAWAEITHNATGAMWLYFSGTYKV